MSYQNLMLVMLLALSCGCVMEEHQSRPYSYALPITSAAATPLPAPSTAISTKDWLELAGDLGDDLKAKVLRNEITLAEATRIENERREEWFKKIQLALDKIKKEDREEYAKTRPRRIQTALMNQELCLGMDDKDVLVCLGSPKSKGRTVTKQGANETWEYNKISVWFEEGRVSGWHEAE